MAGPPPARGKAPSSHGVGLHVLDGVVHLCAKPACPCANSLDRDEAASRMPGVLLTLTADDWDKAGHGELTVVHPMPFGDGRPMNCAPRPAFARDKVHHVGDIVAAVIAETRFAAEDAAEAVAVDYEPLPAVTTTRDAVAPGAPLVHPEFGTNLVFEIERGSRDKTEAALATAAKVVELHLRPTAGLRPIRWSRAPISATTTRRRTAIRSMRPASSRIIAPLALGLHAPHSEHKIRVISPDVGGGFGVKGFFATEVSTVVWAARILGRPVKWTATRTESFLSDAQARDHDTTARMGFSADGRIVAMQVDTLAALGGYLSNFAPSIPGQFLSANHHRPLSHAKPSFARARRLHQHRADRRLSRLGPAGSDMEQRAIARTRRARARHRRCRDAPAQSDRARRLPVFRARRPHL